MLKFCEAPRGVPTVQESWEGDEVGEEMNERHAPQAGRDVGQLEERRRESTTFKRT